LYEQPAFGFQAISGQLFYKRTPINSGALDYNLNRLINPNLLLSKIFHFRMLDIMAIPKEDACQ
jgi:hypothetical protein